MTQQVQDLGPLTWNVPIVTKNGGPTPEFQRAWNTQRNNNTQIGTVAFGSGAPTGSPADGAEYINTGTTPYTLYIGKGGSWTQVGAIKFTDLLDAPHSYQGSGGLITRVNSGATGLEFDSISAILDSIGATQGDVLYRSASGWAVLTPGTSGQVLQTNGTGANPTWVTPSGGGGGALTFLDTITTTSGQTSIAFSSSVIPASGYSQLVLRFNGNSTLGSQDTINMQFNGDTGSNYNYTDYRQIAGYGGAGGGNNNQSSIVAAYTFPPGSPISIESEITISWYLLPLIKSIHGMGSAYEPSASFSGQSGWALTVSGGWNNTAAITSITVFPASGSAFTTGSIFNLYGVQ